MHRWSRGQQRRSVNEDGALTFDTAGAGLFGISDADGGNLTVTVTASDAAIGLAQTTGLTLIDNDGSDGTLQFSGSQANIDAAVDGLSYTSDIGFDGVATLTVLANDGGLTDSVTTNITVTATDDISGTIFEDVNGDSGLGDAVGSSNVTVYSVSRHRQRRRRLGGRYTVCHHDHRCKRRLLVHGHR